MSDADRQDRVREATRIFLRLREDPENTALLAAREAFLARGPTEREVYEKLVRAWQAARERRPMRSGGLLLLLCAVLAGLYVAADPLRIQFLADHVTDYRHEAVMLESGDAAVLDAGSALSDDTISGERRVALLRGAAFFEVDPSERRFVVEAGDVTAEVIGTSFEISRLRDAVLVTVAEGSLRVTTAGESWRLSAGERLRWNQGEGGTIEAIAPANVAAWRDGQLVTDGMSFGEVAEVLDRRLSGRILVLDGELSASTVSGGLDLTRPEAALQTLAEVRSARVISAPPFVTVIYLEE